MVNDAAFWERKAAEENARAAELAGRVERLRLKHDTAMAELVETTTAELADAARRHAEFLEKLREVGGLGSADETHILHAMRHARANADASALKALNQLTKGLAELLDPELFAGDGTPLPAWTADDPDTLLNRIRAEVLNLRAERARAGVRLDDLVKGVAKALDMPTNTPPLNLISRAGTLHREVTALRRTVANLRDAAAARQAREAGGGVGDEPPVSPTWDDVKGEFGRVIGEIGDILREAVGGKR